jgi:hypothetical protein
MKVPIEEDFDSIEAGEKKRSYKMLRVAVEEANAVSRIRSEDDCYTSEQFSISTNCLSDLTISLLWRLVQECYNPYLLFTRSLIWRKIKYD